MNVFRQMLKTAGHHPPVGTWLVSASPIVAEAVGHAGFDWGVIDLEHTPLDMMGVIHLLQAAAGTKMLPVLRVHGEDTAALRRVLDAGAQTLLLRGIADAAGAQRAVAATRLAPRNVSRATRYGMAAKAGVPEVGIVAQLESAAAIERLEAIAAVDGVDAVFLGPTELAHDLGHAGQPTHPAVAAAMNAAVRRCKAVGKPVGTVGATPELVVQYRAAGFDFVAIGSDLGLLMRGAQAAVQSMRTQEVGAHVHTLAGGTRTDDAAA